MTTRETINDISFKDISIRPPVPAGGLAGNGNPFISIANNTRAQEIFGSMSINQSIFGSGGMDGFVLLNDPNPDEASINQPSISTLAKSGSYIKFSFSTINEEGNETSVDDLIFYVYNVSIVSNISPGTVGAASASSQRVTYRLEFVSYESSMANFRDLSELETRGYIGKIAHVAEDQDDTNVSFIDDVANTLGYFSPTPEEEQSGNIVNTCIEPPIMVETQNGVWFKPNQTSYPWGKPNGIPTLLEMVRACLNYAVPQNEPSNPSYVFFQDFKNWNFVPIGGSNGLRELRLSQGTDRDTYHRYTFTNDQNFYRRAESFKLEKDIDLLDLQGSGAFSGSYDCVEPDWRGIYNNISIDIDESDPEQDPVDVINPGIRQNAYYHDFMSSGSHLKCSDVSYTYRNDFFTAIDSGDDGEIEYESNGVLMSNTPIIDLQNDIFFQRSHAPLNDPVYGYFNENYLNKPYVTDTESYSVSHGREDKFMWQTMFDLTPFPFETNSETNEIGIYDVVTKVKEPLRKNKLAISLLKDLKEQWNRYRYSICCDSDAPDEFMAMLVGYHSAENDVYVGDDPEGGTEDDLLHQVYAPFGMTGPGGTTAPNLFRYSFVEVEVWPRQLIKIMGEASECIPEEFREQYGSYFDYVSQQLDINPSTGPHRDNICSTDQHEMYISSGITGTNDDGTPLDPKYLGITFEFGMPHMNEDEKLFMINWPQELFVIPVDGGKKGLFTAYNLNEIVNNIAFTNAGINEMGYDYPEGFDLMPVGGMTAGLNLRGKQSCPAESFGNEPVALPQTYMGRVVKMTAVKGTEFSTLKTEESDGGEYDGPEIPDDPDATVTEKLMYLTNSIFGSENIPTPFCGSTADIKYYKVGEDDESVQVDVDRIDLKTRPNILDPAKPQPRSEESETVYLFSVENDHDGRCSIP